LPQLLQNFPDAGVPHAGQVVAGELLVIVSFGGKPPVGAEVSGM
jgi:hypothetical protein